VLAIGAGIEKAVVMRGRQLTNGACAPLHVVSERARRLFEELVDSQEPRWSLDAGGRFRHRLLDADLADLEGCDDSG